MDDKMTYNGDKDSETYLKNEIYTTVTTGAGINLIIQNKRHFYKAGNIAKLMIVNRGSGYKIGDIITVLDADGNLPVIADRANFKITRISDEVYDHDITSNDVTSHEHMMRVVQMGNTEERELFSIRCPSIGNHFDTRDETIKNAGSIIIWNL